MGSLCNKRPEVIEIKKNPHNIISNNNTNKTKNSDNKIKENLNENSFSRKNFKEFSNEKSGFNSSNNSPNKEFVRGEFISEGLIGNVYSGLSLDTGKIVVIKHIEYNKLLKTSDLSIIEDCKKCLIDNFKKKFVQKNLKHENINTYLTVQESDENKENCKF